VPDLTDNLTHIERINGVLPALPIKDDAMNDAQFADLKQTLVILLTPGYELSKLCLAQMQALQAEDGVQAEKPQPNEFIEGERAADTTEQKQGDVAPDPASVPGPIAAPPAPPIAV
jgi:hypothetical protein